MQKSSLKAIAWLPVVVWAALLFGLSSITGSQIPSMPIPQADKLAHIGIYGIFGILCFGALRRTTNLTPAGIIWAGTLLALGYGISDEVHQIFVPGRASEFLDLLADVLGGWLGCLAASLAFGRSRREGRGP